MSATVGGFGKPRPIGVPWRDPSGRLSPFKIVVLIALFVPAAWVAFAYTNGMLGARPVNQAIHQIGLWGIRLLFLALAITPARNLLQWPQLLLVRRMIGVAAFAYLFLHLCLYIVDENFHLFTVGSEIVLRIYLTIGFSALVGLAVLAATSTDGWVRELGGRRWRHLHQTGYAIGVLAVIHMFMQSKADVTEATWMGGLFAWLMGYRLIAYLHGRGGRVPLWMAAALSVAVAALTACAEAFYFWLKMGVAPTRVLAVNLTLFFGLRPGWVVLIVTLTLCATAALLAMWRRRRAVRPA
ncbi:MAG: sulfite oxidase heme-binding subunit YedZ [Gemmatimonas sp.]